MPRREEICEVRTAAGIFRDWTAVSISFSYGTEVGDTARLFSLQLAEVGAPKNYAAMRLKPGDIVDIALAGKVIILEGHIKTRQAAFDANRHGIQIEGMSKAAIIFEASLSVDNGQFRGYTFEAIARSVLERQGLKFRMENPPPGASEPFRNVIVQHGETTYDFLERLARQRGLWIQVQGDGSVVAGHPDDTGSLIFTFEEGRNILAARCVIDKPEIGEIIMNSQQPGSDSLFGRRVAEVAASAAVPEGGSGKRIVLAEQPLSQRDAELRANLEAADLARRMMQVSITYKGWLKPGTDDLWSNLGVGVRVKSPMLFPTQGGEMPLRLWGVTYTQDAETGTRTTLELVSEAAFQQRFPPAQEPSPFAPKMGEAKPESPQ
jgi:prophage tail gpP-like protein